MKNEVYEQSKRFALRIVKLQQYLKNEKKEYVLSKQILRSGTSIGANVSESCAAESRPDFIHKLQIALKECCETRYWLELLYAAGYLTKKQFCSLYSDSTALYRLLTSILKTMKNED